MIAITSIKGIGPDSARILKENGFTSIKTIAEASVTQLQNVPGFGAVRAARIIQSATHLLEQQADTPVTAAKKKTTGKKTEKKKKKDKKKPLKKKEKEKKKKDKPSKKQKKGKKDSRKKKKKK